VRSRELHRFEKQSNEMLLYKTLALSDPKTFLLFFASVCLDRHTCHCFSSSGSRTCEERYSTGSGLWPGKNAAALFVTSCAARVKPLSTKLQISYVDAPLRTLDKKKDLFILCR